MPIDPIPQIAERYHVPQTKVRELYGLLQISGGRQAQFTCDELGGPVQWMPGMIMVTRWNDHQLKARVDGLCSELAAIVQGSDSSSPAALMREPNAAGESWWPAFLGHPASAGEQNGMRYAYFPEKKRLLIQQGAHLQAYDTTGHHLTGASQQQGLSHTLTFSTSEGPVDLKHLACVPLKNSEGD